jgi:hypothetical protein
MGICQRSVVPVPFVPLTGDHQVLAQNSRRLRLLSRYAGVQQARPGAK